MDNLTRGPMSIQFGYFIEWNEFLHDQRAQHLRPSPEHKVIDLAQIGFNDGAIELAVVFANQEIQMS